MWQRLTEQLFSLIQKGGLGGRIPAYNGGLFDSEKHPFLEHFAIGDYYLARAIDFLSRTQPRKDRSKGEGRKKVTYRDLDVRHLGSIYEGILEYSAHIADQEMAIVLRGSGNNRYEEYVTALELKAKELEDFNAYKKAIEEDSDNPIVAGRSKVTGVKNAGQYFLVSGGRDSKRKSSGSYYTPDYIVQYIVDNTLGPLVRGETRQGDLKDKPLNPNEILSLKVLDPAMGSGHFLVAATEFLARAYGKAVRTQPNQDNVTKKDEFTRHKRIVAERCIYGVDLNPMAVELSKLSMWLFTMDRDRPLSFLNHHFKCGNALIGAWIEDLGELPKFDAKGRFKKNHQKHIQLNMFEQRFKERLPVMMSDISSIMEKETIEIEDVKEKRAWQEAIEKTKEPLEKISDLWVKAFFGEMPNNYESLLLDISQVKKTVSGNQRFGFSWELNFPEVFFPEEHQHNKKGGFHAIVGNPPYLRVQGLQEFYEEQITFYASNYQSAIKRFDLYLLFIEQGFNLLRNDGLLSFICPHKFTNADFGSGLRSFLASNNALDSLLSFGENQVFEGASIYTGILTLCRNPIEGGSFSYYEFGDLQGHSLEWNLERMASKDFSTHKNRDFDGSPWILTPQESDTLIKKISSTFPKVKDIFESVFQGVVTGNDEIYLLENTENLSTDGSCIELYSHREKKILTFELEILKPIVKGDDVFRYEDINIKHYCIYPYKLAAGKTVILEEEELAKRFPLTYEYLAQYRSELRALKIKYKTNSKYWYSCHRARKISDFERPRIITKEISHGCTMTLDQESHYHNSQVYSFLPPETEENILYWLGLLNSEVLWWYLVNTGTVLRGGYFRFKTNYLKPFPVRPIDFDDVTEKAVHDSIVSHVKERMMLTSRSSKKKTEKTDIEEIDNTINSLIYDLYGLTEADVKVIEKTRGS